MKNRKSIRLRNWDYSQGGHYYVTICSQDRECIFGEIIGSEMELNEFGKILNNIIDLLPNRFDVDINAHQIMPNHLHIIIQIVGAHHDAPDNGDISLFRAIHKSPLQRRSLLSQIIGYFKMNTSKSIHEINPNLPVWQRNYYEHIIRNEKELNKIQQYILDNPLKWDSDKNNPININLKSVGAIHESPVDAELIMKGASRCAPTNKNINI